MVVITTKSFMECNPVPPANWLLESHTDFLDRDVEADPEGEAEQPQDEGQLESDLKVVDKVIDQVKNGETCSDIDKKMKETPNSTSSGTGKGTMGNSLCKDCFGMGGSENVAQTQSRVRNPSSARDYRALSTTEPEGLHHNELRLNAAAAAEARRQSQEAKGFKNPGEFRRLQERQAKIEKAEEEAARRGQFDNRGGLKWQMN